MRPTPLLALAFVLSAVSVVAAPLKAPIVDGQNNHDWRPTTPHLKKLLEETGLFQVDVASTPPKGHDLTEFRPKFSNYAVLISNYNGEPWADTTKADFAAYVRNGGGFVS